MIYLYDVLYRLLIHFSLFIIDISQISIELEVNKRHSANLEKELQEAQVQLRNAQDVMFRLKEKSKTIEPVSEDHHLISDSNQIHENHMLQKEIATLLKKYVGNNKMCSILSY